MAHAQRQQSEPRVEADSSFVRHTQEAMASGSSDTFANIASEISIYGKKPLPPATSLGIADDEYYMMHRNRGKAIIFNHEQYADNMDVGPREGTKADRKRLKESLKQLGFEVQVLDDLTRKEILDKVDKEKGNHYHYSSDCLVVVVMTHGGENGRLSARDDFYSVSELLTPFMAENCPALATKPKIFIIQACRGERASLAVGINTARLTTDSTKMSEGHEPQAFSIPSEADVLVAFSTFEGRVAYRHNEDGTWYINEFCEELDRNAKTDDLLTMLTRVNRQVALTKESDNTIPLKKQMPMIQSTLTRKIFFSNDRDKQNIPTVSLREINEKLDRLLGLQDSVFVQPRSADVDSSSVFSQQLSSLSGWDSLRVWSGIPAPSGPLPAEEAVLRHAKALQMFLEWRAANDEVQDNGRTLLSLLSRWEALDVDSRKYAYQKAVYFLRNHAKEWPVMQVVDVPDVAAPGAPALPGPVEHRPRKSSRSSTPSVASLPTSPRRPPFK